jgi:hypothetical protein
VLPSGFAWYLFLNVHPFWVLGTALSLPCPWQQYPLCSAGMGHPPAGCGQLISGPTISLGQFLWLSEVPCS